MLRKQVERPTECILCRLVTGGYEGQNLVMHLLIRHAIAFILRGEQHREHIANIASISTAFGNQPVDELIQRASARRVFALT